MAERASSWFERSLGTSVSLLGLLSTFYCLAPRRSHVPLLIFFRLHNLIVTFMFEKLDVYQKAVDFADQACAYSPHQPRLIRLP